MTNLASNTVDHDAAALPNLATVMDLLRRVITHSGTVAFTTEQRPAEGHSAEVRFDVNEVAFRPDLDDAEFVEAFTTMLVNLDRGPALVEDERRETRIVAQRTRELLYGKPAGSAR